MHYYNFSRQTLNFIMENYEVIELVIKFMVWMTHFNINLWIYITEHKNYQWPLGNWNNILFMNLLWKHTVAQDGVRHQTLFKSRLLKMVLEELNNSMSLTRSNSNECFCVVVPSAPPQDVRCTPPTAKSIHMTWQPPPPTTINGILRGYRILFRSVNEWYGK